MKLVILDRDGVINVDSDKFIKSPAEWKPIPGSLEAIARLNQAVDQYINRMIPRLGLSYSSEEGGTMYYHF